jgi:hypothetical protein
MIMIYLHAKREHSLIENYRLLRSVVLYYGRNLNLYRMTRHDTTRHDTTSQPEDGRLSRRHREKFVCCKLDIFIATRVSEFTKLWDRLDDP